MKGIKLKGTGRCVPEKIVTNDDLAAIMDTSDEWISSRTGIRRRHYAEKETMAALCAEAARKALESAGVKPEEIGVCIVATLTPQTMVPSTACLLQRELGLSEDILCFDLNAACSGFIYALHTAECLLNASAKKYGLIVGGEVLSRIVNRNDRGTCILFGDGAGAAVVECREGWRSIGAVTGCRGDEQILNVPGPGAQEKGFLTMEGTKVFKFAVDIIPKCIDALLEKHGLRMEDIDQFVFHQANTRIIDSVLKKTGIPEEKCHKNLCEYGNTSAASVGLVLSELQEQGKLPSGSRILTVGFGGGLTWGGAIIECV